MAEGHAASAASGNQQGTVRSVPWTLGRCTGLASARHPHAEQGVSVPAPRRRDLPWFGALAASVRSGDEVVMKW